jgi:hypothetical protein
MPWTEQFCSAGSERYETRSFDQKRYRALEPCFYREGDRRLSSERQFLNAELLKYTSQLGWEHIHLTGQSLGKKLAQGRFRP